MGLFDFVGDILGTNKSDQAMQAQSDATSQANDTQKYIYDQTRSDQQPWRQAGASALGQMQDPSFQHSFGMSDFQQDPGYQFRMQEGQKALERSAAARGGLASGATLQDLTKYSQGVASDEYNNAYNRFNNDQSLRFNRLSTLSGLGQTANSQVAAAGQNYGNQVSSNQVGLGNADAAAYIGQGNMNAGLIKQGASLAVLACDERMKTNIEEVSKEDIKELRENLKAYKFNYKDTEAHGADEWIGVMAQDLEKSKLGRTVVFEDKDGYKKINATKLMSVIIAALAGV